MQSWVRNLTMAVPGAVPGGLCLLAGLVLLPCAVQAQQQAPQQQAPQEETEDRPWYFSFGAGYNYLHDNGVGPESGSQADLTHDGGYSVGIALGYAWERVRVEAAYTFSNNAVDKLIVDNGFAHASGEVQTSSYMANAYYEFPEFRDWWITPYVGGGVGVVSVAAEEIQVLTSTPALAAGTVIDDSQAALGWQIMLGTAIHLSKRTTLDVGYRFFQTTEVELHDSSQASTTLSFDPMHYHNFDVRLRVAF